MGQSTRLIVLAALVANVYTAPQFITMKDGKLGVNFGGYHAAVGIGGLLGNGAGGGLFAEAGTPTGQSARAGLGGAVSDKGPAGGLYAGATAGGNVKAEAGLSGRVSGEKSAGIGFANAQAGDRVASAGLGGEADGAESHGFTYSGTKGVTATKTIVKETDVQKPTYRKVHKEFKFDSANEVVPTKNVALHTEVAPPPPAPAPVDQDAVYQPAVVVEKHVVRTKPRHHFRKTAYVGGYVGSDVPPPPQVPVVPQPVIEKRVDVLDKGIEHDSQGAGHVSYTKTIGVQRNPTFFADIFNIPIQTLRAVGNFLGNTAGSTNVSVQKSASVHADSDVITSKHSPGSSAVATDTQVSVQTPNVSQIIDDVFAIPINTLSAVNKFLENNVPARKKVIVDSDDEPTSLRVRKHGRRRNKQVYVINESVTTPQAHDAASGAEY